MTGMLRSLKHSTYRWPHLMAASPGLKGRSADASHQSQTSRLAVYIHRCPTESGASAGYRTGYLRLEATGKGATNIHLDSRLDSDPSLTRRRFDSHAVESATRPPTTGPH